MDTRRLYSFVRVVDAGSITRATDLLHIAQPALSQQMTALALESLFGQQLLSRSKQGVEPTEAGSRSTSRSARTCCARCPPGWRCARRPWPSPRASRGTPSAARGTSGVPMAPAIERELELTGSFRFNDEIDPVLLALADGSLDVDAVVTHEYAIEDALTALHTAADPVRSGKVLLRFG